MLRKIQYFEVLTLHLELTYFSRIDIDAAYRISFVDPQNFCIPPMKIPLNHLVDSLQYSHQDIQDEIFLHICTSLQILYSVV